MNNSTQSPSQPSPFRNDENPVDSLEIDESERITSQDLEATFKRFEESESQSQSATAAAETNATTAEADADDAQQDEEPVSTNDSDEVEEVHNDAMTAEHAGSNETEDSIAVDSGAADLEGDADEAAAAFEDDSMLPAGEEKEGDASSSSSSSSSKRPKQLLRSEVKRYTSIWALYLQDERANVLRDLPGLNNREVVKEVGNRYKLISEEQKQHYQAIVQADRDRYEREIKEAVNDYANDFGAAEAGDVLEVKPAPSTNLHFPMVICFHLASLQLKLLL